MYVFLQLLCGQSLRSDSHRRDGVRGLISDTGIEVKSQEICKRPLTRLGVRWNEGVKGRPLLPSVGSDLRI